MDFTMKDLTAKQNQMLTFIKSFNKENGYPPTVKEIMEHFNFASPTSVTTQLQALEKKGSIKRLEGRARGIIPISSQRNEEYDDLFARVAVLEGYVKAGEFMSVAEEEVAETIYFPRSIVGHDDDVFFMRVKGDSMIDAHIQEDDLILIKKNNFAQNGDIVVAIVDIDEGEEITVKRFFQDEHQIRLMPENESYEPIIRDSVKIVGKVVSVIRLKV